MRSKNRIKADPVPCIAQWFNEWRQMDDKIRELETENKKYQKEITTIKKGTENKEKCPNCKSKNTIIRTLEQKQSKIKIEKSSDAAKIKSLEASNKNLEQKLKELERVVQEKQELISTNETLFINTIYEVRTETQNTISQKQMECDAKINEKNAELKQNREILNNLETRYNILKEKIDYESEVNLIALESKLTCSDIELKKARKLLYCEQRKVVLLSKKLDQLKWYSNSTEEKISWVKQQDCSYVDLYGFLKTKIKELLECPITLCPMKSPAICPSGVSVDSFVLQKLVKGKKMDPFGVKQKCTKVLINRFAKEVALVMQKVDEMEANLDQEKSEEEKLGDEEKCDGVENVYQKDREKGYLSEEENRDEEQDKLQEDTENVHFLNSNWVDA